MHELAVCQSLLREAERIAETRGARTITRLAVVIGPLSGVEAPLLERAFTIARAGTIAERATLAVEQAPVVVWCPVCEKESAVVANKLLCIDCGNWRVTLRSGDELVLKQVELSDILSETAAVN